MGTLVGLEGLVYAIMTDEATNTYDAPVAIAPAVKASIKPKVNSATLYGDNRAVETASSLGETDVEIETTSMSLAVLAALLGHTIDQNTGVMTHSSSDSAPYVAIGFKSLKTNGKYRYIWLLKGKFMESDDEYETGEDKPKFKIPKIKATFVTRLDGKWKYSADDDDGTVPTTFLDAVYSPTIDLVAPTVSCSPVDGAIDVAVGSNIVFTFNKAINPATMTSANIFLMKADGTVAPASLTIGTNNTVVTLNPTDNLANNTSYVAVVTTNVKSAANVSLAANNVFNFVTVA